MRRRCCCVAKMFDQGVNQSLVNFSDARLRISVALVCEFFRGRCVPKINSDFRSKLLPASSCARLDVEIERVENLDVRIKARGNERCHVAGERRKLSIRPHQLVLIVTRLQELQIGDCSSRHRRRLRCTVRYGSDDHEPLVLIDCAPMSFNVNAPPNQESRAQ